MVRRSWRLYVAAIVLIAGLLQGCDRQEQSSPPPAVPEVGVMRVRPREVVLTTELPGRTCPYLIAEVRPQVSGIVQKRLFTEGSDVKAGDVLYQLDAAPFKAAMASATANLEAARRSADRARAALPASVAGVARQEALLTLARSNLERLKRLEKLNAVARREWDQAVADSDVAAASLNAAKAQVEADKAAIAAADAAIKQAQAAVQSAQVNLDYTRITAPISGRVGRSSVTDGATVTAYQPTALATIQQLDPIYVDVPQSTADLLRLQFRLKDGSLEHDPAGHEKVKLTLEDGTAYAHEGTLQFRDVTVNPSTGSVILRAEFPNPDGVLLPFMFVRAAIMEGTNRQAIMVPQQAISRDPRGTPRAMVVDADNKAAVRILTLDRAIGNEWLVRSGLAAGERLIVDGLQKVRPGVSVIEARDEGTTRRHGDAETPGE